MQCQPSSSFDVAIAGMERSNQFFFWYVEDLLSYKMKKFGNASKEILREHFLQLPDDVTKGFCNDKKLSCS